MKKSFRRDHPSEPSSRHRREKKGDDRWEFSASGSLIALGSTDAARRAAYRTSGGELRFLPL